MSELETFFIGLLITQDPLRSVLPESYTRHRAERLREALLYVFAKLPVVIEVESVCGRWHIVVRRTEPQRGVPYDG